MTRKKTVQKKARGKAAGGPWGLSETQLRTIEECVSWGWSLENSCNYAGVPASTFYDHQRRNPEIRSRLNLLREKPALVAKRNVAEAIMAGDVELSKWYLEKKVPEFAPHRKVEMKDVPADMDDAALQRALERLIAASR